MVSLGLRSHGSLGAQGTRGSSATPACRSKLIQVRFDFARQARTALPELEIVTWFTVLFTTVRLTLSDGDPRRKSAIIWLGWDMGSPWPGLGLGISISSVSGKWLSGWRKAGSS